MYGMIHKAVRDMVVESYDDETWQSIARQAGIEDKHLLSLNIYDDILVYRMVETAAERLGKTTEQILEGFGKYFIRGTISGDYKNLIRTYGQSSFELLGNLNKLHSTIKSTFTGFSPPVFNLRMIDDSTAEVEYISKRAGLSPFVRGLILGLADFYQERIFVLSEKSLASGVGEVWVFTIGLDRRNEGSENQY